MAAIALFRPTNVVGNDGSGARAGELHSPAGSLAANLSLRSSARSSSTSVRSSSPEENGL